MSNENTMNPYSSPEASLTEEYVYDGEGGSIETALAGQYDINISNLLSEAWQKVSGSKLTFFLAYICTTAVFMFLTSALQGGLEAVLSPGMASAGVLVFNLAFLPINFCITAGIYTIAIRHICGQDISVGMVFSMFSKIVPLAIVGFLIAVLTVLGYMLFIIPGIYLTVAYFFAIPLIIDHDMSPWQAMETSRKAVSKKWFPIFGLGIIITIIIMLSAIPLGIGIIWTYPMKLLLMATTYKNIFGVKQLADI